MSASPNGAPKNSMKDVPFSLTNKGDAAKAIILPSTIIPTLIRIKPIPHPKTKTPPVGGVIGKYSKLPYSGKAILLSVLYW
jgi:hypothetical protein